MLGGASSRNARTATLGNRMQAIQNIAQVIIGLGILNVWILRFNKATAYRGGQATNLREEFAAYGLPAWMLWAVGILKVAAALALLVGIFVPVLVTPAAGAMAFLMVGAIVMHLKVKDAPRKSLPAAIVLVLSLVLVFT
jgi:uncharacterized membrane protein YphA (DoxX/SURF4 family)